MEYSYVPVCQSYVLVCYSYVPRMYSYVVVCYSYVLVCTRMSVVYHPCGVLVTIKHNKTPHKMTCDLVSVQGWPLNTGENNKERQT